MTIYVCSRYRATTVVTFELQHKATKDISRLITLTGHDVIVPHLTITQFLDDSFEEDRDSGLESGLRMLGLCDALYVFMGFGISYGMEAEIEKAKELKIETFLFSNISELEDLLKKETSKNRAINEVETPSKTRNKLLKNLNNIMMCTSSRYLDEVIENKNNILDIFDLYQGKNS